MRVGYRHCDSRFPFLWQTSAQPPARWHGPGEGPAHYFADTPVGAWAEFLRHEGIVDAADLAGVQRSLWVVELPAAGYTPVQLPEAALFGNEVSYSACQAEAARLRAEAPPGSRCAAQRCFRAARMAGRPTPACRRPHPATGGCG